MQLQCTTDALLYIEQENLIEVRFDLADTQTHRPNYDNSPAHARRGLMNCEWLL